MNIILFLKMQISGYFNKLEFILIIKRVTYLKKRLIKGKRTFYYNRGNFFIKFYLFNS